MSKVCKNGGGSAEADLPPFLQLQRANAEVEYANALAQEQQAALAGYGEAYLALGIMPSAEMLAAMGMTEGDARKYIAAIQAEKK